MNIVHSVTVSFVTFYANGICSERESLAEKIGVRRELVEHMVRGNFVVGLEPNFGTKNSLSDVARMKFKNVNFFLPRKEYTRPKLY